MNVGNADPTRADWGGSDDGGAIVNQRRRTRDAAAMFQLLDLTRERLGKMNISVRAYVCANDDDVCEVES